jgi:hypothetical protein
MHLHSLRPYLDPAGTHFWLKLSLVSEEASILEKAAFPFVVISDSDPLTHLIDARFVTDAGHTLKRVFLLVQRDRYHLGKDELWPISNHDINQSWEKAFSLYARGRQKRSVITLADQIDNAGGITPLHSLFFCKKQQIFFHPPCPHCGLPLHQCYDDELLSRLGFQSYVTSLKRYLFCPSCFASKGVSDFYVYELEEPDPSTLKNRWDLMKAFGLLVEKGEHSDHFPCPACPDKGDCYGTDDAVLSRLVPFSFYPFYMLIFEAMSLHALDFLSLVSGASFEEVEAKLRAKGDLGRMDCVNEVRHNRLVKMPFLFDKDERYFVEVLYLKLSFLGELLQAVFSSDQYTYKHPDLRLSLDRIWVSLPAHDGLLPFFWDFNIVVMDIIGHFYEAPSFPKTPPSYGRHFLGLVWFYALLVNRKQDMAQVYHALGDVMNNLDAARDFSFKNIIKEGSIATFLPENIFWRPEEKAVPKNGRILWERSLSLGWSLLETTFHEGATWSQGAFCQQLEVLKKEVKKNLFQESPRVEQYAQPSQTKAIYSILTAIIDKWRLRIEAEKKEALEKTVVLSAEDFQKEAATPQGKGKEGEEEMLAETVVLSPEELQKQVEAHPVEETTREDLAETVVLSPGGSQEKIIGTAFKEEEGEEKALEKTVVISPGEASKVSKGSSREFSLGQAGIKEKEAPSKVSTNAKAVKKTAGAPPDKDFVAETIFLTPDNQDREETDE